MRLVNGVGVQLYEGPDVPEILVTGIDRVEMIDVGLYRFVCTIGQTSGGVPERRVNLYLDATVGAIAHGIMLAFAKVVELRKVPLAPLTRPRRQAGTKH